MKQQEKMIRDMEASVSHREAIAIRGEGQSKTDQKRITKGDFHRKKQELRKKISEIQKVSKYGRAVRVHVACICLVMSTSAHLAQTPGVSGHRHPGCRYTDPAPAQVQHCTQSRLRKLIKKK